jgi:hypothetical protein
LENSQRAIAIVATLLLAKPTAATQTATLTQSA